MGIRVATGRQTARLVWSSSHLLVLSPTNAAAAAAAEDSSCSASPLHLCTVKQQQKQQRQQQRHDRLDPKPAARSSTQSPWSLTCRMWGTWSHADICFLRESEEQSGYSCFSWFYLTGFFCFFWRASVLPGKVRAGKQSDNLGYFSMVTL